MNRAHYPIYQKAVSAYLSQETRKLATLRKDPALSQIERKLIETRLLFKKSQFEKAHTVLERLSAVQCDFLNGEKEFLRANSYSYQGQWQKALLANQKALIYYSEIKDRRGLFLTHHNLAIDFSRLNLMECCFEHFNQALGFAESENEKYTALRGLALQHNRMGNVENAVEIIDKCLDKAELLNNSDRALLYLMAADIIFRTKDLIRTNELIDSALKIKGQRERARSLFYKALIQCLNNQCQSFAPLPEALKKSEEYKNKWQLIRAIQHGEAGRAEELWQRLVQISPEVYSAKDLFKTYEEVDSSSLFMTVLQQQLISSKLVSTSQLKKMTPKMRSLYETLSKAKTPLRKEVLIENIWQEEYSPELEARFYKLIERAKQRTGITIKNKNQSYFL